MKTSTMVTITQALMSASNTLFIESPTGGIYLKDVLDELVVKRVEQVTGISVDTDEMKELVRVAYEVGAGIR